MEVKGRGGKKPRTCSLCMEAELNLGEMSGNSREYIQGTEGCLK
jgi:hypothetical protein